MSEFDWIEKYLRPIASGTGAQGLLDDVALVSASSGAHPFVVTMDTLVEGVHFLASDPPGTLGQKIARVNISDIICKGALPRQAMLSVAISDAFNETAFESFCGGLKQDLEQWDIELLGGDLVSTPGPLVLTLALTGECLGDSPVSRSGACVGDGLYVTGRPGAGCLGLEHAIAGHDSEWARHYRVPDIPKPDIANIVSGFATASIDISDGVIAEARHISHASSVGVSVNLDAVPWAETVSTPERAIELGAGGDDYQTLMTVPSTRETACLDAAERAGLSLARIGEVEPGHEVRLLWHGDEIAAPPKLGYQHQS